MTSITLKLPDALDNRLSSMAREKKKTKSALIQEALEEYLAGQNGAQGSSCFELARDVWGSLEGPGDLSYNAKHMEGYGRCPRWSSWTRVPWWPVSIVGIGITPGPSPG